MHPAKILLSRLKMSVSTKLRVNDLRKKVDWCARRFGNEEAWEANADRFLGLSQRQVARAPVEALYGFESISWVARLAPLGRPHRETPENEHRMQMARQRFVECAPLAAQSDPDDARVMITRTIQDRSFTDGERRRLSDVLKSCGNGRTISPAGSE